MTSAFNRAAAIRITAVTALVVALGAVSGAITGLLIMAAAEALAAGRLTGSVWRVYGQGAALGAIFGALVGTPVALLLLRQVPLWRATVETAGAAGVGVIVGSRVAPTIVAPLLSALVFALLAAWRLRRSYARSEGRSGAAKPPE
jgi:hypothetical protein